ncbi:uncharacterized protein LOC105832827 [Monomorium pharaonis]|uniref:uncharacterized protein LOC105832827 n=1 Tax=Monomorium pharaonis TaxID=307658 RepID=UPI0017478B0F|nr:uncharacterized protein LOC105832827 [Monomorium pharaonis]
MFSQCSGARKEMIRLEVQYFNLNRILLLAVGLWPYQQSKLTRLQFIFLCSILTTSIIFQLTSLITLRCTSVLVAKVVSSASFFAVCLVTYSSFCANINNAKNLMVQCQHVYDELKDEKEIAIIKEYGYYTKCCTIAFMVMGIHFIIVIIIIQYWTDTFDLALSINVSQPHRIQFITEYFIDQEKYFFLILLHINVAFCVGIVAIIAIGTILIGYINFIFGMFKISSYRIERIIEINIPQNFILKKKNFKSESLICAVNIHRKAIRLSKYLVITFEIMFLSLAAVLIISLCFNFLRIFQIMSSGESIEKLFFPVTFVSVDILYMFLCNFFGQNIIDHNNHVFITVYNIKWYVAPLQIQRMILFLLLNNAKDFTIIVGGIFVGSMENFAMLIKAAISYFTVILSVDTVN